MKKILLSSVVALAILTGCGEDKKVASNAVEEVQTQAQVTNAKANDEVEKVSKEVKTEVQESKNIIEDTVDKTKEVASGVVEDIKNTTNKVVSGTKDVVSNVVDETKEVVNSVVDKTKDIAGETSKSVTKVVEDVKKSLTPTDTPEVKEPSAVEKTVKTIKDTTSNVVDSATKTVKEVVNTTKEKVTSVAAGTTAALAVNNSKTESSAALKEGKALFAACAACHGQKAEKKALGKSEIIAGWEKGRLVSALKGYKDGSYGGAMKTIMLGQVTSKTDAQIDALATYVSSLK